MGFHAFLQSKNMPVESVTAKTWNKRIFKQIKGQSDSASRKLSGKGKLSGC
jgi:ribonucleoside-diphosphate reductase alpha chain